MVAQMLGCTSVEIANLCERVTVNHRQLSRDAAVADPWGVARDRLLNVITRSDDVLLAWGVSPLGGPANLYLQDQIGWVHEILMDEGKVPWTVGADPRHPSRWHQFLSDKYQRTHGGSLRSRIEQQLRQSPVGPAR
jgi:hypothetical protein